MQLLNKYVERNVKGFGSSNHEMRKQNDVCNARIFFETLVKPSDNYPTDLLTRRRQFNAFMDNLRIVCNISPWTRQVFDLWPNQISYSHPCIGTAINNLIFTNISDPCQKHINDCPPDARTAILTLRRHCAALTQNHVECTLEAFFSIKQGHQEVATSYLNRIGTLTRDCYHAGIPNNDAEIIKRAICGGSNHHFYAASYQRFDADIRRAELNDEELLPFAELESHLLNIDDSHGLTLPSHNQRNYNEHESSTRQPSSTQSFQRQGTTRVFTTHQQQAFSLMMRPYTVSNNNNNRPPHQPHNQRPNNQTSAPHRQNNNNNDRRTGTQSPRTFPQQTRGTRPPFRPISTNNTNQRRPLNNTPATRQNSSTCNAANMVCNNCGRLGHYANRCKNVNQTQYSQNNQGRPPNRNTNNENAAPRNEHAHFITNSTASQSELFSTKPTLPPVTTRTTSIFHKQQLYGLIPMHLRWKSTEHCSTMTFYQHHHKLHSTHAQQNSLIIHYQHTRDFDHLFLTTGSLTVVPHVIIHPFSAISTMLKPAIPPFHLQMEPPRSQLSKEALTVTSPLMKDKSLSLT